MAGKRVSGWAVWMVEMKVAWWAVMLVAK